MDVRPDQLIDVSLAAAEMIVAGLLGTLLYSLRGRRPDALKRRVATSALPAVSIQQTTPTRSGASSIEFVSFGAPAEGRTDRVEAVSSPSETRRRNRADIIQQARQMIDRGVATQDITQSLRLSDGEIALLIQDTNR